MAAMFKFGLWIYRFGVIAIFTIAYSRPFLGVLEAYFPQMASPIVLTPKRHLLTRKRRLSQIFSVSLKFGK